MLLIFTIRGFVPLIETIWGSALLCKKDIESDMLIEAEGQQLDCQSLTNNL